MSRANQLLYCTLTIPQAFNEVYKVHHYRTIKVNS